jgi:hypothetical protein
VSLIAAVVLAAVVHRNPFQFVEPKVPVERRALSPPAKVQEEPRRAESPPLHRDEGPPPLPEFAYQLIGRFGRADDPIAALVGKGQVLTVQNGDTIEDTFVVRRIGVDSVEIAIVNRLETLTIRLQQ